METPYVIPIPKTLPPKSLDEIRPIFLLSASFKLFDFKNHRKKLHIDAIPNGFRENNFTKLVINKFYDRLLKNLDENSITYSIFLDLRKAFDSVNHKILLQKLYHYECQGKMLKLLTLYLIGRHICEK